MLQERISLPCVCITGIGIISFFGQGTTNFRDVLFEGKSLFKRSLRFPALPFSVIAAELADIHFKKALESFSEKIETVSMDR